ncbi:MAG: DUF2889 domain-containing protein [Thauera sp.]|jgi:hypothetical protein|nr:DUF2889 domain-containing protein [Thauera sp.]
MPLPPASPRRRVHRRFIDLEGFQREDGLFELDALLCDVKDIDYSIASGLRAAGDPIHEMRLRIVYDDDFNILDAFACSDAVPYPGQCDTIGPAYRQLIGLNLTRGFRRQVGELFAGVSGCSHLTELLNSLPTAAIQTKASFWPDTQNKNDEKPFQLDRCHALDTRAEAVRLYYPKWYRGPQEQE